MAYTTKNQKLALVYGDLTLGVHGSDFDYIFSYQTGGLESLVRGKKEWLYRSPRPTFWRATTDNDRGNGFPYRSGMWLAADQFVRFADVSVAIDNQEIPLPTAPENNRFCENETADCVQLTYTYETITVPSTEVTVIYRVTSDGRIHVRVHYTGKDTLPEFPVFGLRLLLPTCATGYIYEGLSGETYPDRMAGGRPGTYDVTGLSVTPYLVPQDCGMHMDTHRVTIYRDTVLDNTARRVEKSSLTISEGGKPLTYDTK